MVPSNATAFLASGKMASRVRRSRSFQNFHGARFQVRSKAPRRITLSKLLPLPQTRMSSGWAWPSVMNWARAWRAAVR
ncbi:hypothetical protein D3C76_1688790 [compost metagenome]